MPAKPYVLPSLNRNVFAGWFIVKLWKLVVLVDPSIVVVEPDGVTATVPLLALKVPLFVKLPEKVKVLAEDASKVPALVMLPVTLTVGSLVLKSRVPAECVSVPLTVNVPLAGLNVEPEPLNTKLL